MTFNYTSHAFIFEGGTVTSNGAVITGVGTSFILRGVRAAYFLCNAATGALYPIKSVDSETQITLIAAPAVAFANIPCVIHATPGTSVEEVPYIRQLLKSYPDPSTLLTSNTSQAEFQVQTPITAPSYVFTAGKNTIGDGGAAAWKAVASEPTHAGKFSITLSGGATAWYEIASEVLTPEMFGAFSGVGTNQASLNSAIETARSLNRALNGNGKEYAITTQKVFTSPGEYILRNIKFKGTTGIQVGGQAFYFSGSLFERRELLTSDVNGGVYGTSSIPVSSSAGYAFGDHVLIMNETLWDNTTAASKTSEWGRVLSTTTGQIILQSRLKCHHTTAASARILRCPFDTVIDFEDVTLDLPYENCRTGFYFDRCYIRRYINVASNGSGDVAHLMNACRLSNNISHIKGDNAFLPNNSNSRGYVLSPGGSFGGRFSHTSGNLCRHVYANGAASAAPLSTNPADHSVVGRNISYNNTTGHNIYAGPIDSHNGCADISHGDGEFWMAKDAIAGEDAIVLQGAFETVGNIKINGDIPRNLILFQPSGHNDADRTLFSDVESAIGQSAGADGFAAGIDTQFLPSGIAFFIRIGALEGRCAGGINVETKTGNGPISLSIQRAVLQRKQRNHILTLGAAEISIAIDEVSAMSAIGAAAGYGIYTSNALHQVKIDRARFSNPNGSYHLRADGLVRFLSTPIFSGGAVVKYSLANDKVVYEKLLRGQSQWDAPSIAPNSTASTTITVQGVVPGDHVESWFWYVSQAVLEIVDVKVTAADTVTMIVRNNSASAIDPGLEIIRVYVRDET